jgi:hypothetical protein
LNRAPRSCRPALAVKRTFVEVAVMSAIGDKADIARASRNVQSKHWPNSFYGRIYAFTP